MRPRHCTANPARKLSRQLADALGQFDITRMLQTQRSLFEVNLDYVAEQEARLNAAADIAG